jgi:hypothetical protein
MEKAEPVSRTVATWEGSTSEDRRAVGRVELRIALFLCILSKQQLHAARPHVSSSQEEVVGGRILRCREWVKTSEPKNRISRLRLRHMADVSRQDAIADKKAT